MEIPFVPTFAIYVSETAQRAVAEGFTTNAAAVDYATRTLRKYVIRRSFWRINREYARGFITHTQS